MDRGIVQDDHGFLFKALGDQVKATDDHIGINRAFKDERGKLLTPMPHKAKNILRLAF